MTKEKGGSRAAGNNRAGALGVEPRLGRDPSLKFQGAGPVPALQAPSLRVPLHSTDGWNPVAGSLPDFCLSPPHSPLPRSLCPPPTCCHPYAICWPLWLPPAWHDVCGILSWACRCICKYTEAITCSLQRHPIFTRWVRLPRGSDFLPKQWERMSSPTYPMRYVELRYQLLYSSSKHHLPPND